MLIIALSILITGLSAIFTSSPILTPGFSFESFQDLSSSLDLAILIVNLSLAIVTGSIGISPPVIIDSLLISIITFCLN